MFLWNIAVTSLVEVWIEIYIFKVCKIYKPVTSLVEVWIEIAIKTFCCVKCKSLPLWKCGLKYTLV